MDIEEFLDRELSGLGLEAGKTETSRTNLEQQPRESFESSPLFDSARSNLGKGDLETAEQSYSQLWGILTQQKLKWSRELYGQLAMLAREFSGVLAQAYNEVRRKASQIYELIGKGRAAMKEGKREVPFKIYAQLEEINNSIPNVFFEEKKAVQEQIIDFYRELRNTTDNELVRRVSSLVQEINRLIDRINAAIRANDMTNAIVSYNKCIELYNQVPEGFLKYKNSAGMRLLDVYKSLSIYNEIAILQNQLQGRQLPAKQQPAQTQHQPAGLSAQSHMTLTKSEIVKAKKEHAKRSIEKGFYNEAAKGIEEVLQIEPNDAEAKAIHAKIKTLQ